MFKNKLKFNVIYHGMGSCVLYTPSLYNSLIEWDLVPRCPLEDQNLGISSLDFFKEFVQIDWLPTLLFQWGMLCGHCNFSLKNAIKLKSESKYDDLIQFFQIKKKEFGFFFRKIRIIIIKYFITILKSRIL
jgi:hypothetical protein